MYNQDDDMDRRDIAGILQQELPGDNWTIDRSKDGLSQASYIARRGHERVFIKLDAYTPALQRLAALGVAPAVLASGTYHGHSFVLQAHVTGTYPDWRWFSSHLPELSSFIKKYQTDETLVRLLAPHDRISYQQHVLQEVRALRTGLDAAATMPLKHASVSQGFADLAQQASQLPESPLIPTHADPNYKNFLLTDDRIYMLDWDDVVLSDPMRDVGLLLWWYVPETQWNEFFASYNQPLDAATLQRIYWWSARASLRIALWFDNKGDEDSADEFTTDFIAVLNRRPNPHAPFNKASAG